MLREVEAKTGILSRIIEAITDRRHKSYMAHSVAELVKQRMFQIACVLSIATSVS
ncbi:MAG: transposase [Candidatus Latescibacteria bacterium]|nr:transposase [Candidatus Latescibacterota bacterium]